MDSSIEGFLNANKTALLEIYKNENEKRGEGICINIFGVMEFHAYLQSMIK